jgi:Flp pilus assembly protein TadD
VLLRLARLELDADQAELAAKRCRRAVELAPEHPGPALCLGRALLRSGETATARAVLRRAAALGRGSEAGDEAQRLLDAESTEQGF